MVADFDALQRQLAEKLPQDICLVRRPDGAVMLRTQFEFPDGDRFPIHVSERPYGGVCLSDHGHTLMHLSYDHDLETLLKGTRGALLDRIVAEAGLERDGGVMRLETPVSDLPGAVFRFGQALTRIYDLGLHARSGARSTFHDDLADIVQGLVPSDRLQADYIPNEVPNAEDYPVDYRILSAGAPQLFLYGIANRDKARLTTIILLHFHLHHLEFDSLLVFRDQEEIPRPDLARLSNAGGEMVSSLGEVDHLRRKLSRHVA